MQQVTTRRGRRTKRGSQILHQEIMHPLLTSPGKERKAIRELKEDKSRMVLTADKGVALVVIDTEEYKKKAQELLQQPTYQPIPTDPTFKYKNKLINMLKSIKAEGGITEAVYKKLYPTGAGSQKFYGLPKIHKEGVPLRPIVSSIGAVTYYTSKELSRIIKPLVGKSPYHIQNSKDFIQQIQGIQLQPNQCMVSFDVKPLFTSVPIQPAITIIMKLLEEDQSLQQRTTMSVNNITCLAGILPEEYLLYLPGATLSTT